ncbi:MAG: ATP-binding protein, partial [bacterium]
MKNWGIRTRVLLLALLPAVMIAVALAGYMVYRVSLDAERELRAYGRGLTRQLAAVAEFSAYAGDQAALRKIALAALDATYISAIAIYDVNGLLIASSGALPARLAVIPPKDPSTQVDSSERGLLFAAPIIFHHLESNDFLFVESSAAQLPKPAATIGWVTLTVSLDLMQQRKREAMFFALLSTFAVLALGGVLAVALGRQVTQPILRLENTVARIQRGHLEARVISDSGGDLQRLEVGLNAMAETLHENRALLQKRIAAATRELEEKKTEAERSNMAKSRFLAAASHDLRQPLLALSLFAADLKQQAVTSAQQRLSRQINESVDGISYLLDTLLDISRLDLTEVAPQETALPLNEVFRHLEASFSRLAQNKGLRFRYRPTLLWTHSDPILLERLLGNLLANAIAYTASGVVFMAVRRQGDEVRIEVRDSGIGIAPELQHAVFEEFFQVANAGRVHGHGLGLGLAIVRRIACLLGASVGLRSVPGKGSVFSV